MPKAYQATHDLRAGGMGVLQIAFMIVIDSITIQMLFNLGYSYPMELNFMERLGQIPLVLVHLCTDAIFHNRLSW